MFRRKVKVFGKSVSLTLIIALVLVVGVVAAQWFSQVVMTASVDSGNANLVEKYGGVTVTSGDNDGDGQLNCGAAGDAGLTAFSINMVGATPGDTCTYDMAWYAPITNTLPLYPQPATEDPSAIGILSLVQTLDGGVVAPDGYRGTTWVFTFLPDATEPNTSYGPFDFSVDFTESP